MAGQFSMLIPQALGLVAIVLAVFGFLSYKTYDLLDIGYTWQGLAFMGAVFVAFAILINVLRRFFQRNTGRLVFALWVIAILGAYFAFLVTAPVKERNEVTKQMEARREVIAKEGTITSAGTTVTGTATKFSSTLSTGDMLVAGGLHQTVKSIANDTSLTLEKAFDKPVKESRFGVLGAIKRENQYPMGIDLAGGTELIYILKYGQIDNNIAATERQIADADEKAKQAAQQNPDAKSAKDLKEKAARLREQLEGLRKSKDTAPDKAAEVVRHRVDPNGTKGIPVTTFGNNRERLRIQLPRASQAEVDRIKTAIKTQGRLTFHICTKTQQIIDEAKRAPEDSSHVRHYHHSDGTDYVVMNIMKQKKITGGETIAETVVMNSIPGMDGSHIVQASAQINPNDGGWEVDVTFDAQGSTEFALLTGANIGNQMAIVLDNDAKSAPVIKAEISSRCQITGNFSKDEAERLATVLTQGSLPAEVVDDTTFVVGPSLGDEQIQSGFRATVVATLAVILFMLVYYRLSGAIAAICMLLNVPMLLGMMGFFKATLTLPGIAGIVLTLGMAVDANVLIIERLREELARGRSLKQAVAHGFDRAFLTIIDCHMTTLISSIVLYYLGTGPVRGFAVSLSMGILTTLFCNLWLNWILTEWLVNREAVAGFNMMQMFKETHIDFMGSRKIFMAATGALAAVCLALFIYHTATSKDIYDVDFTGGTLVQFNFAKGKAKDDAVVKKDVKEKVGPELAKNVEGLIKTLKDSTDVAEKARQSDKEYEASKTDLGVARKLEGAYYRNLATALEVKLPKSGESISKDASGRKNGMKDVIDELEGQLKTLQTGDELTAQSFGEPEEGTGGKFRTFTVTTRIVNTLISSELANTLRIVYPGDLEPEPVQANESTLTMRLVDKAPVTKDALNEALQKAMSKLGNEPEYGSVKNELLGLSVASVTAKDGYQEAEITGLKPAVKFDASKPVSADKASQEKAAADKAAAEKDAARVARIRQALEVAALAPDHSLDRIGGPISRTNAFGAQIAGETGWMSLIALFLANLAVFIYLWFRFEFSGAWGFGAIVALLHDVVIAAGAVVIAHSLGFPILINLNIVAALLTITGFSVNDTIVVFDRIREVKAAHPTRSYEDIVNEAINATLSRTILTSTTVVISVVSLLVLGGPSIRDMAFTLLVGFLVGTYSSIFIASPLMIWWYKRFGTGRAPVPTQSRPRSDTPTGAQGAQI